MWKLNNKLLKTSWPENKQKEKKLLYEYKQNTTYRNYRRQESNNKREITMEKLKNRISNKQSKLSPWQTRGKHARKQTERKNSRDKK
jgi:hypothetical protein